MEMDNNLLTAMVERWRKETHTFHLLEGEMMITLKDVAMLTEFPINGDVIIESSQNPLNGWGKLINKQAFRHQHPQGSTTRSSCTTSTRVYVIDPLASEDRWFVTGGCHRCSDREVCSQRT
ncbi:unnamed protein product [Linum tenue]|uniref:Aminotransferase-like plant mobile domain-containing protein n=1 Tax=Linum tenue TaxID=586396 RepID=A0AAV0RW33_9ROSI|nr:unnamed protein product [Linum tenue]